jgi:hypothetical protein
MDSYLDLPYGPVFITGGAHKGRIGFYDDIQTSKTAIVYFGNLVRLDRPYLVSYRFLREITTQDLLTRMEEIERALLKSNQRFEKGKGKENEHEIRADLLSELVNVTGFFADRVMEARFNENMNGKRIFISHSSHDKPEARSLSVDLSSRGHRPWLDEWEITVGESIPKAVGEGIENCDVLILMMTKNSMQSQWVENEWHTKYWSEILKKKILLLPALFEECEIPTLLRHRKYANFTSSFSNGLEEILAALRKLEKSSD